MVGEYMKKVMATKEKNNTKKHNTIKSNKIKEKPKKKSLETNIVTEEKNEEKKQNLPQIFIKGLLTICIFVYRTIKYIFFGILWPIAFIVKAILRHASSSNLNIDKLKAKAEKSMKTNYNKKNKDSKNNEISDKKKQKEIEANNYKNENLVIKKEGIGTKIKAGFAAIGAIPTKIKEKFDKAALIRSAKNKKDFETMSMLVDFSADGEDVDTKGKRVVWEYVAINEKGKKVRGYFEAYTRVDVQSFLLGEGLAVYSIRTSKLIQALHGNKGKTNSRMKPKDLIFLLAQLSTYLKSGIPLVDSLNILIRQVQKKSHKNILREVTYDLTVGESLSVAMEKRGKAFDKLLINMIKAAELTGELPEALDDMVDYYTQSEEARKEMISALTYPTIVFIFAIGVITFVMIYVVPKFVDIYKSMDSKQIPKFTLIVMNVSNFVKKNIFIMLAVIIGIIALIIFLHKKVKIIRTMNQWILMHIPVVKNVIIYNEVTMFSKTFASLLSHNVYITDSMDILNRVTNNEFFKMMILDTVANLARGDKISAAFKDQWAFPIPAYEMIVTGEKTGQLAEMMERVSIYYQGLHKTIVTRMKALVEPILIVFLTFAVGIILLAIIIPMFNMYQQVQSLG